MWGLHRYDGMMGATIELGAGFRLGVGLRGMWKSKALAQSKFERTILIDWVAITAIMGICIANNRVSPI